jgi:hypothetical protein
MDFRKKASQRGEGRINFWASAQADGPSEWRLQLFLK